MPLKTDDKQDPSQKQGDKTWKRNFPFNIDPRIRLQAVGVIFGSLLISAMAVTALNTARIPYFAIFPGSVRDVLSTISVTDTNPSDAEVHPTYEDQTKGTFAFVTARVTGTLSPLRWIRHNLDGNSQILHLKVLSEDRREPEDRRRAGQIEIRNSQSIAESLAFQTLGIEVPETPAGLRVVGILECADANNALQERDVILGIDGTEILTSEALGELLEEKSPGDTVSLTVNRANQSLSGLEVILGSRGDPCQSQLFFPDPETPAEEPAEEDAGTETGEAEENATEENDPQKSAIGITIAQIIDRHPPIEVNFQTGDVGGSSAGLAFTLGLIDLLSPGDLSGGLRIASTGTISLDGTVNPIGGVREKLISVEREKFDIFFVPASQVEELEGRVNSAEVIGVENIQDALDSLYARGADRLPRITPDAPDG